MLGFLSNKSEPAAVEGPADKVAPLHSFDDGPLWRAFILYSLFVFDDALDAGKLHHSLERLTRKDGWWKLGSRLRQNKNGRLEYHLPASFSAERPSLAFSHATYDVHTSDHPLASRLPKATAKPSVVGDPDEFLDLMRPAGCPLKLNDYINSDRPQLGLHIVSFKDKTFVTLYWPHTLFDAMGQKALLEAWTLMMAGKEDQVKRPYGMDNDPLVDLGAKPTEQHKLESHRMGTFGLLGYGLGQVSNFLRKQENRIVCVPSEFVQKLRNAAITDLASAESSKSDQTPFLSEGDILCAWWTRLAIAHLPTNSTQTIVLNNAYCLRKPLAEDLIPQDSTYMSNAIGFLNVLIPVKDVIEKPVSYVASSIRSAIVDLGTRSQVEAFFALVRENSARLPPFFGDRNMHMITYSNWSKAKLYETNFASALKSDSASNEKMCRPSYIQNNQFGLTLPNGFPIIGKDNSGNYWLSGYMNKGHWAQIEELLAKEA